MLTNVAPGAEAHYSVSARSTFVVSQSSTLAGEKKYIHIGVQPIELFCGK